MKKEIVFVPKDDEFPLDILERMKEETKSAWIFVHDDVIRELKKTCSYAQQTHSSREEVFYKDAPHFRFVQIEWNAGNWKKLVKFISDEIKFEHECMNPENIIFLKMED